MLWVFLIHEYIQDYRTMHDNTFRPLITTIIPTYRRPEFVKCAIRSVLTQTFPYFNVCVYDNASDDETSKVVAEMAKEDVRVRYHCHRMNIGANANFNFGMRQVKTPFFSLLGDDNTLLPHFFEDAIEGLSRYKEAILFAGQSIKINEKGQELGGSVDLWRPGLIYPPDGLLYIFEKGIPNWESVMFRSVVISSVGLLDPAFGGGADQDFMMRIAREHAFHISKKPYAHFLYHRDSWTNSRGLDDFLSEEKKLLRPWLRDRDLKDVIKVRIKKASNKRVEGFVSGFLCRACLEDVPKDSIRGAVQIIKSQAIWSFKLYIAVAAAKLSNSMKLLRYVVSFVVRLYLKISIQGNKLSRKMVCHWSGMRANPKD